jgi:hypothetical protein
VSKSLSATVALDALELTFRMCTGCRELLPAMHGHADGP